MNVKFKNRNRKSIRLQHWNYGWNGSYFITICTQDRKHSFGDVWNGVMVLNETGKIAEQLWQEIPCHFSFIKLDNFVVMPDHLHGIMTIVNDIVGPRLIAAPLQQQLQQPLQQQPPGKAGGGITGDMNPVFQNNISRVIRWYKGRCSFDIHKVNPVFQWQSGYYDHIIRNNAELERIRNYIVHNPSNWKKDRIH